MMQPMPSRQGSLVDGCTRMSRDEAASLATVVIRLPVRTDAP
jgi:hypothetical protein